MLRNYLTIAIRNLARHRGYAAINLAGLAVGLGCCLMIVLFVRNEWSFDRFHTHAERTYRITTTLNLGDHEAPTIAPYFDFHSGVRSGYLGACSALDAGPVGISLVICAGVGGAGSDRPSSSASTRCTTC